MASELEKLQSILESKEAQMARVMSGDGQIASLRDRYDRMFTELQAERDELKKERMELLQVCLLESLHLTLPGSIHEALFSRKAFCIPPAALTLRSLAVARELE